MSFRIAPFVLCGLIFLNSCSDEDAPAPVQPPPLPTLQCTDFLINGYCDQQSYAPGETVTAFLHGSSDVPSCALNVLAYNGANLLSITSPIKVQQITNNDPAVNGYGYKATVQFKIPENCTSGLYRIEGRIPFIVRPAAPVDVLVVYPSNTANAYSTSGGKSFYSSDRATELSFHRPIALQAFSTSGLQWFHQPTGFSTGFICDADLEEYAELRKGQILAVIGHSEYWSRKARNNVDRFVNEGHHAVILSGNTMWWQVRYTRGLSGLVCFKDKDNDPVGDPLLKTVTWIDPLLNYHTIESIGQDFERGGYGLRADNGWNGFKIIKPHSPLLEGSGLQRGDVLPLNTVEYDGAPIAAFDADGYPLLDLQKLGAIRGEIIGFDKGYRGGETIGTFIVYQRTTTSGIIINAGSTDWCSINGMGGPASAQIKLITQNAIDALLKNRPVFSPE